MDLEKLVQTFHENYQINTTAEPLSTLNSHRIKVKKETRSKSQITVRAFHYCLLSSKRRTTTTFFSTTRKQNNWEELNEYMYYEKELEEFALRCLYITNTILGECTVERSGKDEVTVVQIQRLSIQQLTKAESLTLQLELNSFLQEQSITFGADVELMLFNEKTKKYVSGNRLTNKQFGFDQAIALFKHRVYHPIIEIRPKPASSSEGLHKHLERLYKKLIQQTTQYDLKIITLANPHGRFFLGGHLHFGNIPVSFKHVNLLDQFVAIPLSIVEQSPSFQRRQRYGQLGSIRRNAFNGFEYRVLPTWFSQIPTMLPL